MRLQVLKKEGIEYGGRRYAEGEEFDVEATWRGSQVIAAFLARRIAKKSEPVVVGTPTPPPQRRQAAQADTSVTPSVPLSDVPLPEQQPDQQSWMQPTWATAEQSAESAETAAETGDETAASRRRSRYARRDLRPAD